MLLMEMPPIMLRPVPVMLTLRMSTALSPPTLMLIIGLLRFSVVQSKMEQSEMVRPQ